eukprot:TRINITY_DN103247_c0_g1_i1.p1 TRINITY_DN103247_c0_g1~~TRINITY_DN103247_c0_g1_i1.p1  ORF type:complete len:471 (+),score=98.24 TRINITY_DN103247_c0_g1_i1:98-1510(+)
MKIWGPKASKRSAAEVSGSAQASTSAVVAFAAQPTATGSSEDSGLACIPCGPAVDPVAGLRVLPPVLGHCFACVRQQQPAALASLLRATTDDLSDGALRLAARYKHEEPVDVVLEAPPLRGAADVRHVLKAAAAKGGRGIRTLRLGPWGEDALAVHTCGSCGVLEEVAGADLACEALLGLAGELWSAWPLRSFTLCDMKLTKADLLQSIVNLLPSQVGTLRLEGLALGSTSAGQAALQLCCSALRRLQGPLQLRLGNNNLKDADIASVLEQLSPAADTRLGKEMPVFTEISFPLNPDVTCLGLQAVLGHAMSLTLENIDFSECNVGSEGAVMLAQSLKAGRLPALQRLSLYRCGIGREALLSLIEAVIQSDVMRSLNVVANAQHGADWLPAVGGSVRQALTGAPEHSALRTLTLSCPDDQLEGAQKALCQTVRDDTAGAEALENRRQCRVILVPNEQNNYNRAMFQGHIH